MKTNSEIYGFGNDAGGRPLWRVFFAPSAWRAVEGYEDSLIRVEPLTLQPGPAVADWVLSGAGARPADRDEVDERIVADLLCGVGRIIDSQEDVGGFPDPEPAARPLETPEDPAGDDDGDGYTNLEEWLHAFSAEEEGW